MRKFINIMNEYQVVSGFIKNPSGPEMAKLALEDDYQHAND